MDLLSRLQHNISNANIKKEYNTTNKSKKISKVYRVIVRWMEISSLNGIDTYSLDPEEVPLEVDELLRNDGFIVWRNSEIFKCVIPKD